MPLWLHLGASAHHLGSIWEVFGPISVASWRYLGPLGRKSWHWMGWWGFAKRQEFAADATSQRKVETRDLLYVRRHSLPEMDLALHMFRLRVFGFFARYKLQ